MQNHDELFERHIHGVLVRIFLSRVPEHDLQLFCGSPNHSQDVACKPAPDSIATSAGKSHPLVALVVILTAEKYRDFFREFFEQEVVVRGEQQEVSDQALLAVDDVEFIFTLEQKDAAHKVKVVVVLCCAVHLVDK